MNMPESILAGELEKLIKSGTAPVILDARSAYEYRHGHIPGAIHMPFWQSFFLAKDLSASRDKSLVIYCQHGPRAVVGKLALLRAGYTDVRYLYGHMRAWEKAGLPVETSSPH
jgi:rhodanese-related sulfurtransferase